MLHIAICDDDAAELARTRSLLDDFLASRALAARVREFTAAKELLFDLDDGGLYDLYLLDVVMPEMNGIELGVRLRETDEADAILYLTTSEDFAIDSYEARAFWYLVKPVKPEKLFPVLDKAIAARQKLLTKGIHVRTRDGMARVLFHELIYTEPIDRAVRYVCKGGEVESVTDTASFREKIAPLLTDERFYLCGASLVLNLQHVKTVDRSGVIFGTGGQLEIPRRGAARRMAAVLAGGRRKAMTSIWRDLGTPWSILHTLFLFTMFSEFRFPKKKTALLLVCAIGPVACINVGLYLLLGSERIGQIFILTCILPAAMLGFPLVKYRDGRFFFTFLAVCTVSTLITGFTHILNFHLTPESNIVMGLTRLLAYPAVEWAAYRRLREPYLDVQRSVTSGWGLLSGIAALFFAAYVVLFSFPTILSRRTDELPGMLLFMAALPLTYVGIFYMLLRQLDASRLREREQLLQSQVAILQQRVEQTARTEELLSIQRHDLRHRFSVLDGLLEQGDVAAAREYIVSADEALAETKPRQWCKNSVLNAVFAYYFARAEAAGIRIDAGLDFPGKLPVDAAELSTVFANVLENAIHAVRELPEGERVIRCKGIHEPQVMFRVSNPYRGEVLFDEQGRPMAKEPGHGAYSTFEAKDGWFTADIVHV